MRERCRNLDWSHTALGSTDTWSRSLRTMADAVLASRNPMLLFWGPDLVQVYNDALRPSLGREVGADARHPKALGMRAADFWTDVWSVIGPQIEGVMSRGEAVWFENLHLPIERNGKLDDAWWTYSYSPVRDDDSSINGTLVVCLETTSAVLAQKQLVDERRRFQDILDSITDAQFTMDSERRILSMNRAMLESLDAPIENFIGRTHTEAFPESIGTPAEANYRRVAEEGVEVHWTQHYEDSVYDRDVEIDAYPTPSGGIAVFWREVTEKLRASAERERLLAETEAARAAADKANRAKSEFLAVMSHELRTPLNAIGGYAQLIEMGLRGPVTPEQRGDLERILYSQRHLLGLINEVLNYTRVETGNVRYEVGTVRIAELLAATETLIIPQVRANKLTCVLEAVDPELAGRGDADKLRQILLNLLTNAIKFTEPGGRIVVSSEKVGSSVHISVADTGIGIDSEKLVSIFEPFVQVDARLTRTQEGIGLGLAISRDLARGMGGDLIAASRIGQGSVFTMVIPSE